MKNNSLDRMDSIRALIWNIARGNMDLVVEQSFWEIQNGTSTLFWGDSWKQLPTLQKDPELSVFLSHTTKAGLIKVEDYRHPTRNRDIWCNWKNTHEALDIPSEINIQPLLDDLDTRKILKQQGNEILRWGHTSTGTFNIQEAYRLKDEHGSLPIETIWSNI
jgi:hypothetical protein